MLDAYNEAQEDQELLALRHDIALIDARLQDVLGRVDTGESGKLWSELAELYAELRTAQGARDLAAATILMDSLGHLIERGRGDWAAWSEVRSILDQRRRTVESERKRLVDMQQMMTQEKAMVLMAALSDSVRRHVTDPGALAAISADLRSFVLRQARRDDSAAELSD